MKRDEGDERYALITTFVLKREGRRPVGKPNRRWDDKIVFKEDGLRRY